MLSSSASVRVNPLSTTTGVAPFSVNWAFSAGGVESTGASTSLVMLSVIVALPLNGPPEPWSCPLPSGGVSPACWFWSLMV